MSKIASKPIELTSDVKFDLKDNVISIQGPKGSLEFTKPNDVIVEQSDNFIKVSTKSESTAMSGTTLERHVNAGTQTWTRPSRPGATEPSRGRPLRPQNALTVAPG